MLKTITMRKQIMFLFICLVTIPIIFLYFIAFKSFSDSSRSDLKSIYGANMNEVGKNIEVLLLNAQDITLYPISEENIKKYLLADPSSKDYTSLKQNAAHILLSMPFGYSQGIHSVTVYTNHKDSISTNATPTLTPTDQELLADHTTSAHWNLTDEQENNNYLYLLRHLKNPSNLSQYIGFVKIAIRYSNLRNTIVENSMGEQTSYYIITPEDLQTVTVNHKEYTHPKLRDLNFTALRKLAFSPNNCIFIDNYILSAYPLGDTGMILYSITQPSVMEHMTGAFIKNLAPLSLLILFCCLLISLYFSKVITNPLDQLSAHMASLSQENFSTRIHMNAGKEITLVADQFNHMATRLEYLYNQVYLVELKLKQSQLDMLQTQINPHFLYNTLDTIYWMAKLKNNEDVSSMVSNLSQMMRLTLTPKCQDKIPLSRELKHLTHYIDIQKIRYGNKITFQQEVDSRLLDYPVLSFLLQPLVENALVHGLSNQLEGIIKIRIYEDEDCIIYEIANNGTPIDPQQIHQLLHSSSSGTRGLALRNIMERIQLMYGSPHTLTCYLDDTFSVFKIIQPKEGISNDKDSTC